jgi:hypothetical protein
MEQRELSNFEQWMVKSNLKTIEAGTPARDIINTVRSNGYLRVADAIEAAVAAVTDISIIDGGSVLTATPLTPKGWDWIDNNTSPDAQRWGLGIAIERRYIEDITRGMIESGLAVDLDGDRLAVIDGYCVVEKPVTTEEASQNG